jgi:hypothetical protein
MKQKKAIRERAAKKHANKDLAIYKAVKRNHAGIRQNSIFWAEQNHYYFDGILG